MKDLNPYFQDQLDENQSEEMTARLIQQKFDEESKAEWSHYLREKHGVVRVPQVQEPKGILPLLRYVAGAAAAILFLLMTFYWFRASPQPLYQELAISYTQSLPIMADQMAFRKGDTKVEPLRLKANEAFADRQYEEAITLWTQLLDSQQTNSFDRFYLGTAYLLQENPDPKKSIQYLQQSLGQSSELQYETDWVLALAYLQDHQLKLAEERLETIIKKNQFMVPEASQLLKALSTHIEDVE